MLRSFGSLARLGAEDSKSFWRAIRDALPYADGTQNAVWRISTTPSLGAKTGSAISAATGAQVFYDWAGGLLWVEMPNETPHENAVRAALNGQGHALLVRAGASIRASAAVFGPLESNLNKLMRGVKESFDPSGVLNPGRMYPGL